MKTVILLAVSCLMFACAHAQIDKLTIKNNRSCNVLVRFTGDNAACGPTASTTGTISIPPGTTIVTTSSYTGWSSGTPPYFIKVQIFEKPPTCGLPISTLTIGEVCASVSNTGTIGTISNPGCTPCAPSTATVDWTSTGYLTADLVFNP